MERNLTSWVTKKGLIGANGVAAMSSLFRAKCTDLETIFCEMVLLEGGAHRSISHSRKISSYYDHAFRPSALAVMQVIPFCKKGYFVAHVFMWLGSLKQQETHISAGNHKAFSSDVQQAIVKPSKIG